MDTKQHHSDEELVAIAAKAMSDERSLNVIIRVQEAWLLIAFLQLVWKHPGMSERMKRAIAGIGRQFQQRIIELHPETEALLEDGRDPGEES